MSLGLWPSSPEQAVSSKSKTHCLSFFCQLRVELFLVHHCVELDHGFATTVPQLGVLIRSQMLLAKVEDQMVVGVESLPP